MCRALQFLDHERVAIKVASDLDVLIDMEPVTAKRSRVISGRAALAVSGTLSNITGLDISLLEQNQLPPGSAERIRKDLIQVF